MSEASSFEERLAALREKPALGRKHFLFLFLATGLYLAFELAFNARLLDVVGATMDAERVDEIEVFGRLISGLALTLFVWPKVLKRCVLRRASRKSLVMRLVLAAAACCTISYGMQEMILKGITWSSDAAERRAAATMVLLTEAVHSDDVVLNGMPLDSVDMSSPEAKTFLALLPALALKTENLDEKTEREVRVLVRKKAEARVGSAAYIFNEAYLPSEVGVKKAYNGYFEASDAYTKARAKIPAEQARAYREYRNGLGRFTPSSVPKMFHWKVRQKVRRSGVNVPGNWDPRDKKTFMDQVEKQAMQDIQPTFDFEMMKAFGTRMPADLTFGAFQAQPVIQQRWRKDLGIDFEGVQLRADWSLPEFEKAFYDPWMESIADEEVTRLLAPVSDFEKGGASEAIGFDAIRIAYVPLVAFLFSSIGALAHCFKTTWFALLVGVRRAAFAGPVLAGVVIFAFHSVILPQIGTENPVTRSKLYGELERTMTEKAGGALPALTRGLIQFQPLAYPISEAVRTRLLFGIEYRLPGHAEKDDKRAARGDA